MRAILLTEDLNKTLAFVAKIVPNKGQLPILSNVLIETNKTELKLSGTNLELGLSLSVGAKIEEEGSITVPARNVAEFVSLAASREIILETQAEKLKILADKTVGMFLGISAKEFPVLPMGGENNEKTIKVKVESKKIQNVATKVFYAASVDEARMILTGIKFYKSENKLRVVATDGFRMVRMDLAENAGNWPENLVIPAKTILELAKLSNEEKGNDWLMELVKENNQVIFKSGKINLSSRILEGNFPDVDKIIPNDFSTKVTVDRKNLVEVLKTVAIFARENSNIIKFNIQSQKFKVFAVGGQTGEGESEIGAETEGDEIEVAFNYKFVLDTVNSFDSDKVVISINDRQSACAFSMEGDESLVAVIMPVRV